MYEACHECVKFPREYVVEVGSGECLCVLLGVCECGDAALVYCCEVDEEHVYATRPSVRLTGSNLDVGVGCSCRRNGGDNYSPEYH